MLVITGLQEIKMAIKSLIYYLLENGILSRVGLNQFIGE